MKKVFNTQIKISFKLLKLIFLVLFTLLYSNTFSQTNQASNWIFGNNVYIKFGGSNIEEFPGGSSIPGGSSFNTYEGCAVLSNNEGELLYYTDGQFLYNSSSAKVYPPAGTDPMNGNSTTTQSAIIIPLNNSRFAIVTPDCLTCTPQTSNGLWFYLFNSDGSISGTSTQLLNIQTTERVTAVLNDEGDGYWIIAHGHASTFSKNYYSFSLDMDGNVDTDPVISQTNLDHNGNAIGYMRGSPNCNVIAVAVRENIEILDIDNETGELSQRVVLVPTKEDEENNPTLIYGVEFSPNGRYLYVTRLVNEEAIIRYDLESNNIQNSEYFIESDNTSFHKYCALSLGPDGNIYVARRNQNFIGRISKPNSNNPLHVEYEDEYFEFSGSSYCRVGLPNFSQCIVNDTPPPCCEDTEISASIKSLSINNDGTANLKLEFSTTPNGIDIINVQIISASRRIYQKRISNNDVTISGPFTIPVEFTDAPTQIGSSTYLTLQPLSSHSLEVFWKGTEPIDFSNATNINNIKLLFPQKPVSYTLFTRWDRIKLRIRIRFRDSECKICYKNLSITKLRKVGGLEEDPGTEQN